MPDKMMIPLSKDIVGTWQSSRTWEKSYSAYASTGDKHVTRNSAFQQDNRRIKHRTGCRSVRGILNTGTGSNTPR